MSLLNQQFLQEHYHAAQSVLKGIDTIIVYKGGELSLWQRTHDGYTLLEGIPLISKRYTALKEMAHLPLLVLAIIQQHDAGDVGKEETLAKLISLQQSVTTVKSNAQNSLEEADKWAQWTILDATSHLLSQVINDDTALSKQAILLQDYLSSLKSAIQYNNRTATTIQLIGLDNVIKKWDAQYVPEWDKTRILTVGVHGPREKLIEQEYFFSYVRKKLNLKQVENNKVYYVEMLPAQIANVDIVKDLIQGFLARSELNKNIGEKVLNDEQAMFKDVLSPHAECVVEYLLNNEEEASVKNIEKHSTFLK
jgi:hypothetical protein